MGAAGNEPEATKKSDSLFLHIMENPDGTLTRPTVPISAAVDDNDVVVRSKDIILNSTNNTWLRAFLPSNIISEEINSNRKLPVVLYLHGGGFILFSAASIFYHRFCEQLAEALPAIVISLDYRLSPEHRLPAAYDDAVEALTWIRNQGLATDENHREPWLTGHADFSKCFIMGHSSGANMAYHSTIRAAELFNLKEKPVVLAGLVLNQPFFGGVERTQSELDSEEDAILPLRACDNMWRLTLPKDCDKSHEFCDPRTVAADLQLDQKLPKCLVKGYAGDPLLDRQKEFAKILDSAGVDLVLRLDDQGFHAVELFDPAKARALIDEVKEFVYA